MRPNPKTKRGRKQPIGEAEEEEADLEAEGEEDLGEGEEVVDGVSRGSEPRRVKNTVDEESEKYISKELVPDPETLPNLSCPVERFSSDSGDSCLDAQVKMYNSFVL